MEKLRVAFICVHNSCRSQMAEAISKILAKDSYLPLSAGTHLKDRINEDAVKVIKELHNYDMSDQKSKLIEDITPVDVVVTMGCNVECPTLPSKHREDWGLDDPSGKEFGEFIKTAKLIEEKVLDLKDRIERGIIK